MSVFAIHGSPLPPLPDSTYSPSVRGAYPVLLTLEHRLQQQNDQSQEGVQRLVNVRILGYLMLHGPSDQAKGNVAQEVISCNGEEQAIIRIGQFYYDYFIRPFKSAKGGIPLTPSIDVSRPSFEHRQSLIKEMLVAAPQNHGEAKKKALVRDGFRCLISGHYEMTSVDLLNLQDGESTTFTHCAHIFAQSANEDINEGSSKENYASSVWAVMERFGYKDVFDELNGPKIHRLENVLTLDASAGIFFDTLNLWFESTEKDNTYAIKARHPRALGPQYKRVVTFETPDPVKFPLPFRTYLDIHASCAKVAHLSDAGEHIDRILREMEDIQVLAKDGASARALEFALKPFANPVSTT